jgi:hypothetical protein
VSVRQQGTAGAFYMAVVTSHPGDPADGLLTVWSQYLVNTLLDFQTVVVPFDLTHRYQLTLTASNSWPTTLVATVTDLTTATLKATSTVTNSHPELQGPGGVGLPAHVGTVYYSSVVSKSTGNVGPSLVAPTITVLSGTSVQLDWPAASGGTGALRYYPQWVALDANGFPSATVWSEGASQTALTATLTGLTPGVSYAFRVRVVDSN